MTATRFLVDAQLPPVLADMLRARGYPAEHITDIGPADATDQQLWQHALENNAAIITKDEDFANMVTLGLPGPTVVWVRVGNTRRAALIDWFEPRIDDLATLVGTGRRLIELR